MTGIVIELQGECLDQRSSITGLLRKALVVARKLDVTTIAEWISQELQGYGQTVPDYRLVTGQVCARNPYSGTWIPVIISNPEHSKKLSQRRCKQPLAEIEYLIANRAENGILVMPFPEEIRNSLMKGADLDSPPVLHVPEASLHRILDAVRNTILEWCLQLEKEGILGKGLTFSDVDRQSAQSITFNIGSMSHSQIQQGTEDSLQSQTTNEIDILAVHPVIQRIRQTIPQLNLREEQKRELESDLAAVEAQLGSPSPKQSVIRECLGSVRRILEGAAGGALGSGLLSQLATLLG